MIDVFNVSFETDSSDDEDVNQNLINYINLLNDNAEDQENENQQEIQN